MNVLVVMRSSACAELLRNASTGSALRGPNRDCVYPAISAPWTHIVSHPEIRYREARFFQAALHFPFGHVGKGACSYNSVVSPILHRQVPGTTTSQRSSKAREC